MVRSTGKATAFGIALILLLAACGTTPAPTTPTGSSAPSSGETTGALARVKASGVLRDCIDPEFKPEVYLDSSQQPAGLAVDLAQVIATKLNAKLQFVQTNFDGLIAGLQANKCDIAISGLTARGLRSLSVSFAKDYAVVRLGLAARTSDSRSQLSDFNQASAKICLIQGSLDETVQKQSFPNATVVPLTSANDCFLQVTTSRADGFIVQDSTGLQYAKEHPELKMLFLSPALLSTASAIPVQHGDNDFINFINTLMGETINEGTYYQLYTKNYGYEPDLNALRLVRGSDT
jgi:ABC-type amino acid transport substrate-binding protein